MGDKMLVLDGRKLAQQKAVGLSQKVQAFKKKYGFSPCLTVILVGDDSASQVYVKNKMKACQSVGLTSKEIKLSAQTTQTEVINHLIQLNQDPLVHGILVQLPLPRGLDSMEILSHLDPQKDADGLTVHNLGLLFCNQAPVAPCTPAGIIEILEHYKIPLEGEKAVVIGRSQIVGKPMAHLLIEKNATVTICHSKTKNLRAELENADLVIVAAGQPEFITADFFKKGATVVDVGIHRRADGTLCGDVKVDGLKDHIGALTPVPGGVGPMTIAKLLDNTLTLAEKQQFVLGR